MAELNEVLLVLVFGAPIAWLSQRFRFPNAVAQVFLGIILGSAVLAWVSHSAVIHALGEIGVVLLLGMAGLELGVDRLRAAGWAGGVVAIAGIVLSLLGGYAIGWLHGSPMDESLYLGLALAATSIGITVQVLEQFGLVGHRVADIVVAAAVLDDVVALYFLGATHGILSDGLSVLGVASFLVLAILVLAALFLLTRILTKLVARNGLMNRTWLRCSWILSCIGIGAFITHFWDLSAVVGAFFGGLAIGEGLDPDQRARSVATIRPLVWIMMPFFFVMIGVQAQWDILADSGLLLLVVALIACAVVSKAAGGFLIGSYLHGWRERWIVGFGMVPRGEVGLIIATLGFEQGHMTQPIFVAVVLTTIAVSALGPLLLAPVARQLGDVACVTLTTRR